MVVYNAGSDRRGDQEWFARWRANVASYQRALDRAEQHRTTAQVVAAPVAPEPTPEQRAATALDIMWINWEEVQRLAVNLRRLEHQSIADELDRLAADSQSHFPTVKRPLGLQ
jgi:hypothetical protein